MDKLDLQTLSITNENIKKLVLLFPNCLTEGSGDKAKIAKAKD